MEESARDPILSEEPKITDADISALDKGLDQALAEINGDPIPASEDSNSATDFQDISKALDLAETAVKTATKSQNVVLEPPKRDKTTEKAVKSIKADLQIPELKEPVKSIPQPTQAQQPTLKAPQPELNDPEIDGIKDPKNLSPEKLADWHKLKSISKQDRKALKELKTQLDTVTSDLSKVKSTPSQVPAAVLQELSELRQVRAMVDIKNDPEFNQKYNITQSNNKDFIYNQLAKFDVSKETIEQMKSQGIVEKYSDAWKDAQGNVVNGKTWWEENIIKPMIQGPTATPESRAAAILMEEKLRENVRLGFEKNQAVENASKNWQEYLNQKQETFKKTAQQNDEVAGQFVQELQQQAPWAVIRDIPSDATAEQRQEIESNNKFMKEVGEPTFQEVYQNIYAKDPRVRVQVAATAVLAQKQVHELGKWAAYKSQTDETLKAKDAEIANLEETINNMKKVGQISKANTAPKIPAKASVVSRMNMRNEEAINMGLDEAGV